MLLSNVDMPLLSGPDLGETLKKARPDIHVMLMSGGAKGSLLVLNYGWAFVQKPFVPAKLVQMVTDVLHSQNRSQLGGQEFDSRKDILKDSLIVTPRHDDDFASCGFRTGRASQDIATGKLEEDGEIPTLRSSRTGPS